MSSGGIAALLLMLILELFSSWSLQGAARRLTTQKQNLEVIESVGAAGKPKSNRVKKYFRLEVNKRGKRQKYLRENLVTIEIYLSSYSW